jgi:hypothetical protein
MRAEPARDLTVRLDDAHDLFADPDPDSDRAVSGIEELYRAVKVQTRVLVQRPNTYRVTIELPRAEITDGLGATIRARIKRYCERQIEQSQQELRTLRHQGIDSLWTGVFVLVPCLILSVLCTWLSQAGIHGLLQAALTVLAALFILSAGWVALWFPAEYFLYDTWPFQQDIRVYQQIAAAEVVIGARHEGPAVKEPVSADV